MGLFNNEVWSLFVCLSLCWNICSATCINDWKVTTTTFFHGAIKAAEINWTPQSTAALLFSCALGVAMSYFAFLARKAVSEVFIMRDNRVLFAAWCLQMNKTCVFFQVSATYFSILGNVCKFITIIINFAIWDKHATPAGLGWLTVCTCPFRIDCDMLLLQLSRSQRCLNSNLIRCRQAWLPRTCTNKHHSVQRSRNECRTIQECTTSERSVFLSDPGSLSTSELPWVSHSLSPNQANAISGGCISLPFCSKIVRKSLYRFDGNCWFHLCLVHSHNNVNC